MYITSQLAGKGYKDSDYTIVIAIVWLADGTDVRIRMITQIILSTFCITSDEKLGGVWERDSFQEFEMACLPY